MNLKETVNSQVLFMGRTPGGCKLAIHNLLDNGRDIFQFMQLFNEEAIEEFYYDHAGDIDKLLEDDNIAIELLSMHDGTKLALEKTLMLIEQELKNRS